MSTPDSNSAIHAKETSPLEAENTAAQGVAATAVLPSAAWWRIADFGVLCLWAAIAGFTTRFHEKWNDEAQAWLLARDLPLKTLWFNELRYEGHPGLWHTILWAAQYVFHAPYAALGYIGLAFATAGVAVLIFKAPFPWFVRWPLAFTYVLLYQYAVIARPYTLLPLLCFTVAILFKDIEHPGRMTLVLVLLANLSFHGSVLAACFGLLYLVEAIKSWSRLDDRLRNRYFLCAAVMVFTFLFLFVILKPPPDVEDIVIKHQWEQLPEIEKQMRHIPTPLTKVTTIISGAFLDFLAPSVAFLLLTAAWCFTRRRLLVFVFPVGLMIALYSVVHGWAHHHGTVFIAAITALWIAWPTSEEQELFNERETWALRGMIALLWSLCLINIWDSAVVVKREYLYPYSGADDAARYLKSVGADKGPMFGLLYGIVAVQAHFDHNVFANLTTTYFHHGMPLVANILDPDLLQRIQPEYVVVFSDDPRLVLATGIPELTTRGYEIVHFSDGYYLYKRTVYERQTYFIFRRVQPRPN